MPTPRTAGSTCAWCAVWGCRGFRLQSRGPFAAAWRSLLIPGWGQAALGRDVAGAVLASWEGVTIMMTVKARQELHYLEQSGSGNVQAKRQQVQDWLVLWIFNHLFAGAEAFVSGHLQDFPKELHVQPLPGGIGVSIPIP